MPSPLLFFIVVIIIDLVMKSSRDKKKIEKAKQEKQRELQKKPESVRGMMATLREQIEEERLKEIERRQTKPKQREIPKVNVKEREIPKTVYDDNRSWEEKEIGKKSKQEMSIKPELEKSKVDMKEDLIRGIIFSEILSEPKSRQNQKRSI